VCPCPVDPLEVRRSGKIPEFSQQYPLYTTKRANSRTPDRVNPGLTLVLRDCRRRLVGECAFVAARVHRRGHVEVRLTALDGGVIKACSIY
jgi:hypothetical protein